MFSFITFSFSFLSVNYLFSAPGSERRGRAPPPAGRCGGAAGRPRPLEAAVRPGADARGGPSVPRTRSGSGSPRRSVRAGLVREGIIDSGRVFAGRTACPEGASEHVAGGGGWYLPPGAPRFGPEVARSPAGLPSLRDLGDHRVPAVCLRFAAVSAVFPSDARAHSAFPALGDPVVRRAVRWPVALSL